MKIKNRYLMIAVTYSIMLIFGFVENLKGMAVPAMRSEFNVDFSAIGTMVFCGSLGYLIACFVGGALSEILGHKKVLLLGYGFTIIPTFLIAYSPNIWGVSFFMFLMFCGMGLFEVSGNILGGDVFTKNTAVMLNFMHLFYGLGSIIGPKFAGIMLTSGFTWKQYYMFGSAIVAVFFLFTLFVEFPPKAVQEEHHKVSVKNILADKSVWLLGIALGFAVTLELGTSNWFVNYLSSEYRMNENQTSYYMSLFYVTFVFGRLFGGFIAEKIGYIKCIVYFTIISTILYSLALILREKGAFLISMAGFFVAIIFPTAMAVVIKEYKKVTGAVMGFVITMSAVINMVFNWIIGKTNDVYGVYYGFISFILYAFLTIVFFILFAKALKKRVII